MSSQPPGDSSPNQDTIRIPWKPIEPLNKEDRQPNGALAALDALRTEWERRLSELNEKERVDIRQRSLRRLAVETGILERLYEVDWGLTLNLVAEGFTRDVVERAGGQVDDRTLATLRAQLDSLGLVLDFVRQERRLTPAFIKELHQAITRTQDTYLVVDSLHRVTETTLPKGEWKRQPNHVLRADNTLLEYAPPEQVASEIDRLVSLWDDLEPSALHPVIKAAWLHHRFVQIHPFADGNGRVARALTLLVMEKHHYAPLVVDRWHRSDYLKALDTANDGTLRALIVLFVKLEAAAVTSELERPFEPSTTAGFAIDVAHTLAAQLAEAKRRRETEIQQRLTARATAVGGQLREWFNRKRSELVDVFRSKGLGEIQLSADTEMPPSSARSHWWRRQVNISAQLAGHVADSRAFAGWASIRIRTDRWVLRYVASTHGAGRDPGIMAVTTFAEIEPYPGQDPDNSFVPEPIPTTADAFRFVHSESMEEISSRATELEELLDQGLAVALVELMKKL